MLEKKIRKKGRNCWDAVSTDSSGVLIDARDYYRYLYHTAGKARDYILISGWQFDSEVALLRGEDLKEGVEKTRFLDFLNMLCERNGIRIYILAWDFSILFILEREWMQEVIFNWNTCPRLRFVFDSRHSLGASLHQKFVVIDGAVGFSGGMDICAGRWDDRKHLAYNPDRVNPDGAFYEPYHDAQAYFTGKAASRLKDLFIQRWKNATGEDLVLGSLDYDGGYFPDEEIGVPVEARSIAFSRTQAQLMATFQPPINEIKYQYLDSIRLSNSLIYIENQYFSSTIIYNALMERIRDERRPRLEIIIIIPERPQALVEDIFVGGTQADLLRSLKQAASNFGHSMGIYYTATEREDGTEAPVYIHSKVLIVDDRFLSIGSANTTNRSLGLDTELDVSWEARYRRHFRTKKSIRRVRTELLSEHCGITDPVKKEELNNIEGLVDYLDSLAEKPEYRIKKHRLKTYFSENDWLKALKIDELIIDPEKAILEENLFEMFSPEVLSRFTGGIVALKRFLSKKNAG